MIAKDIKKAKIKLYMEDGTSVMVSLDDFLKSIKVTKKEPKKEK